MSLPLLPNQRIRRHSSFQRIYSKGKFAKGAFLYVWAYHPSSAARETTAPQLGIIVSRKTDRRATRRNLWKRRIREAFRELQVKLKENTETLIKSRECDTVPSYQEIKQELQTLFLKTESFK